MEKSLLVILTLLYFKIITVYGQIDCSNLNVILTNNGYKDNTLNSKCCSDQIVYDNKLQITTNCNDNNIIDINMKFTNVNFDFTGFTELTNLEKLEIEGNPFNGQIPIDFFKMSKLRTLNLSGNSIKTIPSVFDINEKMESIDLSNNKINSFPYQLRNFTALKELNLHNNEMEGDLLPLIRKFNKVEIFDISDNSLEGALEIPENIIKLYIQNNEFNSCTPWKTQTRLQKFNATNNELNDSIVECIKGSTSLTSIDLGNNALTAFPYEFESLYYLNILYINDNHISGALSNDILNFKNLKQLKIYNNEMNGELIIPKSVELLEADNNRFNEYLPFQYGNNFNSELTYLSVTNNNMGNDFLESVTELESLKYLYIDYNKRITEIPTNIVKLTNLEELTLSDTSIKTLPNSLFELKLKLLDISNNYELSTKIKNFKDNSVVENCYFDIENIECYQQNTCKNIYIKNEKVESYEGKFCSDTDLADMEYQDPAELYNEYDEIEENFSLSNYNMNIISYLLISLILMYNLI